MGSKIKPAKELDSGKMSVSLDRNMLEVLIHALECCIVFDREDLPIPFFFLIQEVCVKLQKHELGGGGRIALRKSEFFALADPEVVKHLDEPTGILLREVMTPRRQIG
ncbi:MAG: hypothetical protein R2824_15730 [Saprospiraceae bacterium]|nr:hypothetical protein [Lewinella sp.]